MNIVASEQSMQNWKKQIIIDPHLNALFDASLTHHQLLSKILALPHETIIQIYMKLTSLKHALTKNIQKEIQSKYPLIQSSFEESMRSKSSFENINQDKMKEYLGLISKFNQKYELISNRVIQIRNVNKVLEFSSALQRFKVSTRLLRSMMKDFDQVGNSKVQIQLLNTLKISKILRQISSIIVKFDFSGIKSYEESRHFINNAKGAIFGLIEKELTAALDKLSHQSQARKEDAEKDIINKFTVLNNIVKLKDFCSTYYKNKLKEMSVLVKKSLDIGLSGDQRDPRAYLQTFEEYFINSLKRRIIQNGVIFIAFDEIFGKSNIKTPLAINFFRKYWQNITDFMRGWITFSIQNDQKQCIKQKLSQNLNDSFSILQTKGTISKYLTSIIWKYPIIYESLTGLSNQLHLHIIKNAEYHNYQFQHMKHQFLTVLVPLAHLYYKHVSTFYSSWKDRLDRIMTTQGQNNQNNVIVVTSALFHRQNNQKNSFTDVNLGIVDWLLFNVTTAEIFDHHSDQMVKISDLYFDALGQQMAKFDSSVHDEEQYVKLMQNGDVFLSKMRASLGRVKKSTQNGKFSADLSGLRPREGIISISAQKMISLVHKLKAYEVSLVEWRSRR